MALLLYLAHSTLYVTNGCANIDVMHTFILYAEVLTLPAVCFFVARIRAGLFLHILTAQREDLA